MSREDTDSNYISFGDVARDRCGMQCQYASRYLTGAGGRAKIDPSIRYRGRESSYHSLEIHREDADRFVEKLRDFRIKHGCGWTGEGV